MIIARILWENFVFLVKSKTITQPNYFVIMERLGKKWKQWLTLHSSKKTGAKHKKVQIAVSERKETPLY